MTYDLIVIGSGAAGMMAAIRAASEGKEVLLLEKLPHLGTKLKATGGGRCNITNTLSSETFMSHFGRDGRFMTNSLDAFDSRSLVAFLNSIGVECHAPDGLRIFPTTHNSSTIIKALTGKMRRLGVEVLCSQRVEALKHNGTTITGVQTQNKTYDASSVIIATGGRGYPKLGADGDGYELAASIGHQVTPIYPAMMPLKTKEKWVALCRADTIPKVRMVIDLKKYKKLQATGDLIFTKDGIRGPVVLDFSREITPILEELGEVPLLINLTQGMNEEMVRDHFKRSLMKNSEQNTLELLQTLLPKSLSLVLCEICGAHPNLRLGKQSGAIRDHLIRLLVWMPLTITGHEGFKMAMITRGGISLKEIDPKTMQSKKLKNLYFCGEVVNLDGPCGGYNLQWSFSSGYLAGALKGEPN